MEFTRAAAGPARVIALASRDGARIEALASEAAAWRLKKRQSFVGAARGRTRSVRS